MICLCFTLVAGKAGGRIRAGRHIAYKDETPLANFHLAMLDTVGVPADRLADSNGRLNLLTDS